MNSMQWRHSCQQFLAGIFFFSILFLYFYSDLLAIHQKEAYTLWHNMVSFFGGLISFSLSLYLSTGMRPSILYWNLLCVCVCVYVAYHQYPFPSFLFFYPAAEKEVLYG